MKITVGFVVTTLVMVSLAGCSGNAPDPYLKYSSIDLLPAQDSVVADFNSGWSASSDPAVQPIDHSTPPPTTGTKCTVAQGTITSGGSATEVAFEAWSSGRTETEAIAVYRFPTEAEAQSWKTAAAEYAKYCPQEFQDKSNSVTLQAFSDENTDSVGYSDSAGHWDLYAVKGTIGIFVESQSSDADARQLMVLALKHVAELAQ